MARVDQVDRVVRPERVNRVAQVDRVARVEESSLLPRCIGDNRQNFPIVPLFG